MEGNTAGQQGEERRRDHSSGTGAPKGWDPAFPDGDRYIITNEKIIWGRTELSSGRESCDTVVGRYSIPAATPLTAS